MTDNSEETPRPGDAGSDQIEDLPVATTGEDDAHVKGGADVGWQPTDTRPRQQPSANPRLIVPCV